MGYRAREVVRDLHIFHDSRDEAYRSPRGAQPAGARVCLRLLVGGEEPDNVQLRTWTGEELFWPMCRAGGEGIYEAVLTLPETPCLLWYDFQVWRGGQFYWYGNAEDGLGGAGAMVYGSARSFQMTVYARDFAPPDWMPGAVFYQIFPDRFYRGEKAPPALPEGRTYHADWQDAPLLALDPETGDNIAHDFFGGTLDGIREKLSYLASLGVTGLYLNPIFHAKTNHRFDTTDWEAIDPMVGTKEDFRALCEAAGRHGMRVVLDGVFSHAGSENAFFGNARVRRDSPYRDWFFFDAWPDQYKSWWGFRTLPELNKRSPGVVRYFLTGEKAIVKRWLREGANGWRIDVADELPMDYLREMRKSAREAKPDAALIGEVWEDASSKISYGEMRCYCLGDTVDGVMNYPLRDAAVAFLTGAIDAYAFKRRMDSLYENYPPPFAWGLLNMIGSHDRARILNALAGADGLDMPREARGTLRLTEAQRALGLARLRLMISLIVAMPGMPCLYYGDEAGMEGSADPYNRGTFPWGREDRELTAHFANVLRRKREVVPLGRGAVVITALSADRIVVERTLGGEKAITTIDRGALSEAFAAHRGSFS